MVSYEWFQYYLLFCVLDIFSQCNYILRLKMIAVILFYVQVKDSMIIRDGICIKYSEKHIELHMKCKHPRVKIQCGNYMDCI